MFNPVPVSGPGLSPEGHPWKPVICSQQAFLLLSHTVTFATAFYVIFTGGTVCRAEMGGCKKDVKLFRVKLNSLCVVTVLAHFARVGCSLPDRLASKHTCVCVVDAKLQESSWHAHKGVAGLWRWESTADPDEYRPPLLDPKRLPPLLHWLLEIWTSRGTAMGADISGHPKVSQWQPCVCTGESLQVQSPLACVMSRCD